MSPLEQVCAEVTAASRVLAGLPGVTINAKVQRPGVCNAARGPIGPAEPTTHEYLVTGDEHVR